MSKQYSYRQSEWVGELLTTIWDEESKKGATRIVNVFQEFETPISALNLKAKYSAVYEFDISEESN